VIDPPPQPGTDPITISMTWAMPCEVEVSRCLSLASETIEEKSWQSELATYVEVSH